MSTWRVMTDDLVHSQHETRAEAEAEVNRVQRETMLEIQRLRREIEDKEEYMETLQVVS